MCDEQHFNAKVAITRRQFGAFGTAGALAACAPVGGAMEVSGGVTRRDVSFAADGGTMDGVFLHRAGERNPGVILWPDIAGLRPAKIAMGQRLAEAGYAVLVANPYYRSVAGQQFADFDDWRSNDGWNRVGPWREANTPENVMRTAASVVAWLDAQDEVDSARGIGNQGYCMTGSWTIYAASAVPSRIKAAGSFHSGGLTRGEAMAPVNLLAGLPADTGVLIGEARDDAAQRAEMVPQLQAAASAAQAQVSVEVYDGDHGWTVLDSPAYAQDEADRAWANLLALYAARL
ncbi:dienelactone hydrolase family protein [Erythrobacter sp. EC-HK427]|uniref:dienelactone hydrolase family protein n=1 Tax=Erythrobacter sp. EC-HK427 TaxID=2038396 RepID=UPI00125C86C4|nr:dienelactone hydrolase family protein [Erythrobacter sp. EC-HK427]VVT01368.1 conserved hypothetical protein [Erythrobacter sp. EC-HK427]